jgi:hypothetical protein
LNTSTIRRPSQADRIVPVVVARRKTAMLHMILAAPRGATALLVKEPGVDITIRADGVRREFSLDSSSSICYSDTCRQGGRTVCVDRIMPIRTLVPRTRDTLLSAYSAALRLPPRRGYAVGPSLAPSMGYVPVLSHLGT